MPRDGTSPLDQLLLPWASHPHGAPPPAADGHRPHDQSLAGDILNAAQKDQIEVQKRIQTLASLAEPCQPDHSGVAATVLQWQLGINLGRS